MVTDQRKLMRFTTEGIASLNDRLIKSVLTGCDSAAGKLNLGPAPNVGPLTSGKMRALASVKTSQAQSLDDNPESRVILAAIIILQMQAVVFFTLHEAGSRQMLSDAFKIASEVSPGITMPSWLSAVLEEPVIDRPDSLDFRA
ncbi:hypothetical protein [Marinobacter sp.]|uniref:hypothetical protein n=1 Tax=Marinobacter sp. TaxID=50741 RepID=UPI00262B5663|nr:hypothetical protein [Marinobacter sp.]